ncbi:MAG: Stf0 family sulfotransferase [Bacteroidota bacterium]
MPNHTGAVGCKLFYSYLKDPPYQSLMTELVNDPEILVLHLTRRDRLRAYVSELRARDTGNWNDRKRPTQDQPKLQLEEPGFRTYQQDLESSQAWLNAELGQHRVYEVEYEEMVARPEQVLAGIQDALRVRPRKLFSLLVRQNPQPLENWVANAAEARTWFPEPVHH